MELENIKANKVKMILQFSIPSIIAMLLTSLVTVADGYFLGNFGGKEGLAAVNLGLPIVYLYLGIGLMFAIGGMAIAGRELGAQNIEKCNNVFRQTMITVVVAVCALSGIMCFLLAPISHVLHAEGAVATYFMEYYQLMLLALPVMVTNSSLGVFIRGEGKPQFFMLISILNVVLNIVFDYGFSVMQWGPKGIAAATLLAAVISLLCSVCFFVKLSDVYHFGKPVFDRQVFTEMTLNGSSGLSGRWHPVSRCLHTTM